MKFLLSTNSGLIIRFSDSTRSLQSIRSQPDQAFGNASNSEPEISAFIELNRMLLHTVILRVAFDCQTVSVRSQDAKILEAQRPALKLTQFKLKFFVLRKIISGGQTGADRAGLDFAIEVGLEHGGFVPRGCRAEDGRIPTRYNLTELSSISYAVRTRRNVREADGTMVFGLDPILTGGSSLTFEYAAKVKKPVIHIHKSATDYSDEALLRRSVEAEGLH